MGSICSNPKIISSVIDGDENMDEKLDGKTGGEEESSGTLRILLLGAAESGKTTLLSQIRMLHKQHFSDSELIHRRAFIYNNIMNSMKAIVTYANTKGFQLSSENQKKARELLANMEECIGPFSNEEYEAIEKLWKDPAVQEAYKRRGEFNLNDSAKYFFDNLERINKPNFQPTPTDLIRAYCPTVGIQNIVFTAKNRSFQLFDIGGQKVDRRKWATMYDGLDAIFFCLAISEYDQKCEDDDREARKSEQDALDFLLIKVQGKCRSHDQRLISIQFTSFIDTDKMATILDDASTITSKFPDIRRFTNDTNTRRRLQRDLLVVYGYCIQQYTCAYALDIERREFIRLHKLDNPNREVTIPYFIASGKSFYQIGGFTSGSVEFGIANCYRMDMKTLQWEKRSSIPFPRCHSAICSDPSGRIFLIGGYSATMRIEEVDCYIPENNYWKKLPNLRIGRFKAAAVYYDDRVYVSGGATQETPLSECEVLHKNSKEWKFISPLNFVRSAHQMVLLNKKLYVMGGVNLARTLKTVEYYDVEAEGTWKMGPEMLSSRAHFTATVFRNNIFVFGGEDQVKVNMSVDSFDGSSWQRFCRLSFPMIPLNALAFPMVPNVEEVASKMFVHEDFQTVSGISSDTNDENRSNEDVDSSHLNV